MNIAEIDRDDVATLAKAGYHRAKQLQRCLEEYDAFPKDWTAYLVVTAAYYRCRDLLVRIRQMEFDFK